MQAVPAADSLVAKRVLIVEPVTCKHLSGTVAGISTADRTLVIAPADGSSQITLSYDDHTRFVLRGTTGLAIGQLVRVVHDEELVAKVVSVSVE